MIKINPRCHCLKKSTTVNKNLKKCIKSWVRIWMWLYNIGREIIVSNVTVKISCWRKVDVSAQLCVLYNFLPIYSIWFPVTIFCSWNFKFQLKRLIKRAFLRLKSPSLHYGTRLQKFTTDLLLNQRRSEVTTIRKK